MSIKPTTTLCSECAQYKECAALCTYAEQYVGQDYVPLVERTIGIPTFSNSNDVFITKSKHELIMSLYFNHRMRVTQIANMLNVSQPYISKVVKKYKTIIVNNLKKQVISPLRV